MVKMTLVERKFRFGEEAKRTVDIFQVGAYTVNHLVVTNNKSGNVYTSISVWSDAEYMPEIVYDDGHWNKDKKPRFTIQTCAYGAKEPAEIEKIIAVYQEALEVVKVLTERFCD